jgi:glycosyltransferase involved in cell wall biosynthesis
MTVQLIHANSQEAASGERTSRRLAREESGGEPRTSTTLAVIVPAYNEQYLIEMSLERLQILNEDSSLERVQVLVVDDASTDRTAEAILSFRASLESRNDFAKFEWVWLRHERNQGKGAAIRTALQHVNAELIVIHDADLEYHPRDLIPMIRLFLQEEADAVFGSRFMSGGYKRAIFFRHALGNKLLTFLCDLVSDLNLTDIETCYKMVRTDLLKSIPLESTTFDLEPELVIKLAKRGSRIFEVPISYSGRTYREGKKINWMDGIRAFWAILYYGMSSRLYAEDNHGGDALERLNRAPRFTRWMSDVVRPFVGNRVLEIGAGIGNMSLHLMPRPVYWATDVNPHYLDSLRRLKSARPYMQVSFANGMDGQSFPSGQDFDTVVCLNVVEHLEDDVGALRNIRDALAKDGRAIILVPCGQWLYGSLDEVLGHYRRYSEEQLVAVSQQAGFEVQRILRFNKVGVVAWWLNGQVLRKTVFGMGQIRLLNVLTPLFRLLDPILPLPPLSIIAILKKRDGQPQASGLPREHSPTNAGTS